MHFLSSSLLFWLKFSVIYFLGSKPVHFNDFFEKSLIENLASLLGIDESLIRVVEIVNALGDSRRRRRDSDDETMTVTLEIGDPPQEKIPFKPEETYVPGNSRWSLVYRQFHCQRLNFLLRLTFGTLINSLFCCCCFVLVKIGTQLYILNVLWNLEKAIMHPSPNF